MAFPEQLKNVLTADSIESIKKASERTIKIPMPAEDAEKVITPPEQTEQPSGKDAEERISSKISSLEQKVNSLIERYNQLVDHNNRVIEHLKSLEGRINNVSTHQSSNNNSKPEEKKPEAKPIDRNNVDPADVKIEDYFSFYKNKR